MIVQFRFKKAYPGLTLNLEGRLDREIIGVYGPSGAGKSSFLHFIAGIAVPDEGLLVFNGETLLDTHLQIRVPVHRRRIGLVFQDGRLFPHLPVAQNLRFGWRPCHRPRFSIERVVDLLELQPLLGHFPWQLSGGEAQRVALGRTLLSNPRLLLMDEPLSALDHGLKRRLLPFFRRMQRETQIPMLYVSHDLAELLQLTDRLLVLDRGCILAHGDFLELVRGRKVLDLFHDLGLLNVLPLTVLEHDQAEGITVFQVESRLEEPVPWIGGPCEASIGEVIFIALRPEDITLVKHPVGDISVRNQIRGTIVDLFTHRHRTLCIVDVGLELLVEVTPDAVHGMGLCPGFGVWCLFKAHALRYLSLAH